MKTIGLIGGTSWQSTVHYYRHLNELAQQALGGLHSAKVILYSVDFAPCEQQMASGDWEGLTAELQHAACTLEAAGADCICICTNTMHLVFDEVQSVVQVPLIHLADVSGQACAEAGAQRVGLLGTRFVTERPFYAERMAAAGVEVLVPDEAGRVEVQDIIFGELCAGQFREESRERLLELSRELVARGAQGIVLGCTELELVVHDDDLPVPVFPTTLLHCRAASRFALADEQVPQPA